MTKKRQKPGPKGLGKQSQNFRLPPEMIRRIEAAAQSLGLSKTAYIQIAILDRLKKDNRMRTLAIALSIGFALSATGKAALGKSLAECVKLYGASVRQVDSTTLEFRSRGWNISATFNAERICEKLVYSHVPTGKEIPKVTEQEIKQLLIRNGFSRVLAEKRGSGRHEQTWYSGSTNGGEIDRIGVTGTTWIEVIGGGTFEGQIVQLETADWASGHDPRFFSGAPQKPAELLAANLTPEDGSVRHEPPENIKPYIEPSAFATPASQPTTDDKIRADNEKALARLASLAKTEQPAPTPQPQSLAVSTAHADGPLELVSMFREPLKTGTHVSVPEDRIAVSYNIKNSTPKAIKLTHASIEFRDLLDAPLLKIAVEEDKLYPANETTYLTGTYQVLWDTRGASRLLSLSSTDIKAVLIVDAVMFEDGSVWKKVSP